MLNIDLVPAGEGGDVKAAARRFGLPCIAKSVLGGYEGTGRFLGSESSCEPLMGI